MSFSPSSGGFSGFVNSGTAAGAGRASAAHCKVEGNGISAATVRRPATFRIIPFDAEGKQCDGSNEVFFVAIHGRGVRVRAKVTLEEDGTHLVRYLCTQSGNYFINVSLYGELLPASPFVCRVGTPTACATQCVVSGNSLNQAIARVQQVFEVQFRDAQGQIAHAEELDVYVEPVDDGQLHSNSSAQGEEDREESDLAQSPAPAPEKPPAQEKPQAADKPASPEKAVGFSAEGSPPKGAQKGGSTWPKTPVPKLEMKECVVTSKSPLIVRAGLQLDSERVGQLRPGRKVTLLKVEYQEENDGEKSMRACIALDVGESTHRAEVEGILLSSWRGAYPERPLWWDELELGSPRTPRSYRRQVPLGWVTMTKGDKELITPRTHLHAGQRQQHMQAWARRQAVDKSIAATAMAEKSHRKDSKKSGQQLAASKQDKSIFMNELSSDPKGIGFAYGGVEPGRLHAHGQLVETHKVFYSVGVCGEYRLHIGLRHQTTSIPGSPFTLRVTPGPAHALSTALPRSSLPLRGVVGDGEEHGCTIELHAADKMGNPCVTGGARVKCHCTVPTVTCRNEDQNNGSYLLTWQSESSGMFEVTVTIDDILIQGTPTTLKLVSGSPDLTQTMVEGIGLTTAKAGQPAKIIMRLHDQHGNISLAPPSLSFGLTVVHPEKKDEKEKWKTVQSDEYEGKWRGEEFEMQYCLRTAGDLDLYLWAFDSAMRDGRRELLPASPHRITCSANKANEDGSFIEGFSKMEALKKEDKNMKASSAAGGGATKGTSSASSSAPTRMETAAHSGAIVSAGETILLKPQIRDQYGNPTATEEGTLTIELVSSDGSRQDLKPVPTQSAGLTTYKASYEPKLKGVFEAHVCLEGKPINGSPVAFECEAALPNVAKSYLTCPDPPLYSNTLYEVILHAVDQYGNTCTRGGAQIVGRLNGQLGHGQDSNVPVVDRDDGTYALQLTLVATGDIKLVITINSEKERGNTTTGGGGAGELPPIAMTFQNVKAKEKEARKESLRPDGGDSGAAGAGSGAGAKSLFKKAGKAGLAVKALQGASKVVKADELVPLAVEAFQEAGNPLGGSSISSDQGSAVRALSSQGSLSSS